jgi:hypothetical protein
MCPERGSASDLRAIDGSAAGARPDARRRKEVARGDVAAEYRILYIPPHLDAANFSAILILRKSAPWARTRPFYHSLPASPTPNTRFSSISPKVRFHARFQCKACSGLLHDTSPIAEDSPLEMSRARRRIAWLPRVHGESPDCAVPARLYISHPSSSTTSYRPVTIEPSHPLALSPSSH